MSDGWSALTAHQAAVARPFLAAREAERRHLVVYLSGAHAYGFPSPDSDLDLKCVHVAPTRELVRLEPGGDTAEAMEVVDGVELDYGSNELGPVLRGIVKGNGNYIERLLGELVLGPTSDVPGAAAALLDGARAVVRPLLSRLVARHYVGFARSQLELFDKTSTAKRALYVLRTAATGRHLLATGELVTDIARLAVYIPADVAEVVAVKQRGEREALAAETAKAWRGRLVAAIAAVDRGVAASVLPAEPAAEAVTTADDWLVEVRRAAW